MDNGQNMQIPWFGKNQPAGASALSSEDPPHGADCFEVIELVVALCEICGSEDGSQKSLFLAMWSHTILIMVWRDNRRKM